uniref:Uncharacterized protein n=1 Tax=Anguilla anguilla TaxID=7936 RepID=A0A0E9PIC6_ANGAN
MNKVSNYLMYYFWYCHAFICTLMYYYSLLCTVAVSYEPRSPLGCQDVCSL